MQCIQQKNLGDVCKMLFKFILRVESRTEFSLIISRLFLPYDDSNRYYLVIINELFFINIHTFVKSFVVLLLQSMRILYLFSFSLLSSSIMVLLFAGRNGHPTAWRSSASTVRQTRTVSTSWTRLWLLSRWVVTVR